MRLSLIQRALVGGLILATSGHTLGDDNLQRARELANTYLLVDTHIDVPYRLHDHWEDVTQATEKGEFDYPRAVAGGLNVPFMSIYTPPSAELDGSAYNLANNLIDQVEAIVARAPDKFGIAATPADAQQLVADGRIAMALGMENGAPIAGDLNKLRHFRDRGVSYITLAHGLSNHISDSSYDDVRFWNGLSPFGAQLVQAMNRLGVMVDISHLSDAAAAEAIALSTVPVIASHSSMRKFTPDFERNLDDKLTKALAKRDGVVLINFGSSFITQDANRYFKTYGEAADAYAERYGLAEHAPEMAAFEADYRAKQAFPFATVSDVADHIDHVVKIAGIDHVGIGSDYDGVGDSLPVGLKDVSTYPNLIAELLARRYSEADIEKLLGGNLMRVWKAVVAGVERA
ncbi:dipeptidase [Parahaliea mediterranea]|uniref:dipeptidase n=1 Tax=Parahaliea mediterranea TaxID=651086 RepID=UPI000E2FB97B|nr:dipeptidase [Parahaliea mediterranea]